MSTRPAQELLAKVAHLGWCPDASPTTSLAELAREIGLASLTLKRDDLLLPLRGGTKVRKLDYLLAAPTFTTRPAWTSVGAIGSGHLATAALAAHELGHDFLAHCFWEPPCEHVLATMASIAQSSKQVVFHRSRTSLALGHPGLLLGCHGENTAVIPPGATSSRGMLGLVRAGLELAEQIEEGRLAPPEVIYVALGTAGTAAGLAMGLGLAGLATPVRAVAVVERLLAPDGRVHRLMGALRRELNGLGIDWSFAPAPLTVVRGHVGPAYGHATAASLAACERLGAHGVGLDPIYTGKAMGALMAEHAALAGKHVLFWNTAERRPQPPPDDGWRERLPKALRARLAGFSG